MREKNTWKHGMHLSSVHLHGDKDENFLARPPEKHAEGGGEREMFVSKLKTVVK